MHGGLPQGKFLTLNQSTETASTSQISYLLNTSEDLTRNCVIQQSKMFSDNKRVECESFQDLELWCDTPTMEEPIMSHELLNSTSNTENTDKMSMQHGNPSPWSYIDDVHSPSIASSSTVNTPAISPAPQFKFNDNLNMLNSEEQSLDINFIMGNTYNGKFNDSINTSCTNSSDWDDIFETLKKEALSSSPNKEDTMATDNFVDWDSDILMKFQLSQPTISCDELLQSDYYMNKNGVLDRIQVEEVQITDAQPNKKNNLHLDVNLKAEKEAISTPEVLTYVEQLQDEKQNVFNFEPEKKHEPVLTDSFDLPSSTRHPMRGQINILKDEQVTPPILNLVKDELISDSDSEDKFVTRRHRDDSDDEYTPHTSAKAKKYSKRKVTNVDDDDLWSPFPQLKKARRGRPPKRRESYTSAYNTDDNASSLSVEEQRYRELRNKNNEASKRSRMNRKLKELEMEQLAIDLEARNKKLKVQADVLEDMTKKLKEALMTAILNKK